MTRREAFNLRIAYAAEHKVTRGFYSPLQEDPNELRAIGACTKCGRAYIMFGTKPKCYTCSGTTFAEFED